MFEIQQQCLKSQTVKMGGTRAKWTPNSLNFNVNCQIWYTCGYKLTISEQIWFRKA